MEIAINDITCSIYYEIFLVVALYAIQSYCGLPSLDIFCLIF